MLQANVQRYKGDPRLSDGDWPAQVEQLRKRVATLTAASVYPDQEAFAPAKRSRSGDLPGAVALIGEGRRGFEDGPEPGKADMDT
jgi:hypothetical protein